VPARCDLIIDEGPVWRLVNGIFASNCYVCSTGTPGRCFIVDPGLDPQPIEDALRELAVEPVAVLCTHGHFDHAGSAAHFQRTRGCPVFMHGADHKTLRSSNFLLMAMKFSARIDMPKTTDVSEQGFIVELDGRSVQFHPAPGHTPGSCVLEFGSALFTGDTLYSRGVGLSKLPGEDAAVLRKSIEFVFERFDEATTICPGHGDCAGLGWVKTNNQALQNFLRDRPRTLTSS
jgi:hydroxyacylglutathione hydrolase